MQLFDGFAETSKVFLREIAVAVTYMSYEF